MAKRNGGFIGQDGLNAPDEPTNVSGTAGDGQVEVSFTAPSDEGGASITGYRVTDSTGAHGESGSSSPITVTGLSNGTEYTFRVWAINPFGWSGPSPATDGVSPFAVLALIAGGENIDQNAITQVSIGTTGNATDFGDLTVDRVHAGSLGSSTRGIIGGGNSLNSIDYVTFASAGNATDFGDLSANAAGPSTCSNETRGVFLLAQGNNIIEYVTIASAGNTTNFGDATQTCYTGGNTGSGSSTRGLFYLGTDGSFNPINVINYITIASTGNATDFGDMTIFNQRYHASCSSSTRSVFGGGGTSGANATADIEYVTIASTGNSTDFGDLTQARYEGPAAASSETRGLFLGGTTGFVKNIIDYITIASTGNATDFGDLTNSGGTKTTACSNGHGGLS